MTLLGHDLLIHRIHDNNDVEALRLIRNECAAGFVHDNSQISPERQRAWWVAMRDRVRAWLYYTDDEDIIGYGLVRLAADGRWWNSIAVVPYWRGRGYGSFITRDLLQRFNVEVWAQVQERNTPALHMHHPDDWIEHSREGGIVTFRTRRSA